MVSSHWNVSLMGRMATDMALLSREQMKATAVAREMRVMASMERGGDDDGVMEVLICCWFGEGRVRVFWRRWRRRSEVVIRRRAAVREDLAHLELATAWVVVAVFFRLVEWRCVEKTGEGNTFKILFLWRNWFICRSGMEGERVELEEWRSV
jgi:hypothetical protein